LEIGERVVSDSSAVPTTIGDVSVTTSAAAAATTTTTVLSQVLFSSCNHTVIGSRSGSGVLHFSLNYPFFVVVVHFLLLFLLFYPESVGLQTMMTLMTLLFVIVVSAIYCIRIICIKFVVCFDDRLIVHHSSSYMSETSRCRCLLIQK
jgi:hypothetical protein